MRDGARGPQETERIAAGSPPACAPGDVVLISGDLGAGKTTFVRGACRGARRHRPGDEPDVHDRPALRDRPRAGLPPGPLPPRGLARGRPGRCSRTRSAPGAIAFVEWPEAGGAPLGDAHVAARVLLEHDGRDRRVVTIERRPVSVVLAFDTATPRDRRLRRRPPAGRSPSAATTRGRASARGTRSACSRCARRRSRTIGAGWDDVDAHRRRRRARHVHRPADRHRDGPRAGAGARRRGRRRCRRLRGARARRASRRTDVLAVIDARRGEAFAAPFRGGGRARPRRPPSRPEALAALGARRARSPSATARYASGQRSRPAGSTVPPDERPAPPRRRRGARAAWPPRRTPVAVATLVPDYVRLPDAELHRRRVAADP